MTTQRSYSAGESRGCNRTKKKKKKKNLGLQGRAEPAVWGESHTILIINKPMKFEKKENHTSFDIFPVVTHLYNK